MSSQVFQSALSRSASACTVRDAAPRLSRLRALRKLILPALLLLWGAPALADGFIYVHHPHHPPPPRPWPRPLPRRVHFPLEVSRHKVTIEIDEVAARTRVDETFHNPNNAQLEGQYLFPLPPGAAVSSFSMKMGGKEVTGEILEKEKARSIYEQIVRQVKDPGLLEYVERGLFRARVFPIPPRGDIDVSIEYSEALPRERGTVTYRYPLDTGKYIAGGYKNVVIDLRLRSSAPIRNVYCPSHEQALVSKKSDREARISLEAKTVDPNKDLLVTWNVSEDALAPVLLANRGADAEGFFFLMIAPRPERPEVVPPKDLVFVIDTSGSMMGKKLEQVQKALRYCLDGLNPRDRFNIVDFSTEARRFRDALTDAADENRKAALAYVDAMKARGGTNIEEALRFGLADLQSKERLGILVLLTDGEPTIGTIRPEEILKTVKEKNPEKRRAFVFGVGNDLNAKLLDAIAKETRGSTQYIRPEENLEVPLSNFFDKIDSPVLTDLEIAFPAGGFDDIYPKPLPDVFRGEQLNIFGRYKDDGQSTVVLKGNFQGERRAFEYSLPVEAKGAHNFIPKLWALQKIGYLLEQMRLVGETREVKEEVIRLSKRYGIITPYTSYLIIEEDRVAMRNGRVPLAEPGGLHVWRAARDAIVGGARGVDAGAAGEEESLETLDELRSTYEGLKRASGEKSVDASRSYGALKAGRGDGVVGKFVAGKVNRGGVRMKEVGGRTFYLQGARWVDSALLDKKTAEREAIRVKYLSDEYFELLAGEPGIGKLLSVGTEVTFLWKGKVFAVEKAAKSEEAPPK